MRIKVTGAAGPITFELNDSPAAQALATQLPLTTKVENYSNDEKIFYPEALTTENTPRSHGHQGDLAYYAPWGDVVMFYQEFSTAPGLYALGKCVDGADQISGLHGQVTIEQV